MFLAVSTNVGDVTSLLEAEFKRLDELRTEGVLIDGWVKVDYSGAVLVLTCADDQSLNEAISSFPTAIAGMTTFVTTEITALSSVQR